MNIDLLIEFNKACKESRVSLESKKVLLKKRLINLEYDRKAVMNFLDSINLEYDWSNDLIIHFPVINIQSSSGYSFTIKDIYVKLEITHESIKPSFLRTTYSITEYTNLLMHPHIAIGRDLNENKKVNVWSTDFCMGDTPYYFHNNNYTNSIIGFIIYLRKFLAHESANNPYFRISDYFQHINYTAFLKHTNIYFRRIGDSMFKILNYKLIKKQGVYLVVPIKDNVWKQEMKKHFSYNFGHIINGMFETNVNITDDYKMIKMPIKFKNKRIELNITMPDEQELMINPIIEKEFEKLITATATKNFYDYTRIQNSNNSI